MYDYFGQTLQTKKAAMEAAANKMGVSPMFIEKDVWTTITLKALFNEDMSCNFVLNGSCALSKVYSITQCFTEKLDVTIEGLPNDFSFKIGTNGHKNKLQPYIKDKIIPFLKHKIGNISQERVEICYPLDEPFSLEIYYPSFFKDDYVNIKPKIDIEFEKDVTQDASNTKTLTSFMHKLMPAFGNFLVEVRAMSPLRIFYEEIIILHSENQKMANASVETNTPSYYYNIYQLASKGYASEALKHIQLLEDILQNHLNKGFLTQIEYNTLLSDGIKVLPPEERINMLKTAYKRMDATIFDSSPSMDNILNCLEEIERDMNIAFDKHVKFSRLRA